MTQHVPVLLDETIGALSLARDSIVVDGTLGSGGHGRAMVELLGKEGVYIGIDVDRSAIERAKEMFAGAVPRVELVHDNFRNLKKILTDLNIEEVDAIAADLGWRIEQFEGGSREDVPVSSYNVGSKGFSFKYEEPLLMTYGDPSDYPFTARDIVNEWAQEDIANVLYGYGEERYARRIAKRIVETREQKPIETSLQLAELIEAAVPAGYRRGRIHPATKSFQSLRIAVNDELEALQDLISASAAVLRNGGRLAIITFHSIEDRIVKHRFRELVHDQKGILINKKPIVASEGEIASNPRARSAKLRIFQRSSNPGMNIQ